ncbi:EpsG family protein [Empedobacter tilapiae]
MLNKEEIFFNRLYLILYLILSFVTFIIIIETYYKNKNTKKIQLLLLNFFCIIYIFLFGLRDVNVGVDTKYSILYFTGKVSVNSLSDVKDLGIYFISIITKKISSNVSFFLCIMASIFIIPLNIFIKKININNTLVLFFFFVSFFFFRNMGMNTIRQGVAVSFFLLGIFYYFKNKKIITSILFILAFLNHASIIIAILILIVSRYIYNIRFSYYVYIITTIISITNINIVNFLSKVPVINILVQDRLESYYTENAMEVYRVGFRPDFWLFNTLFAIIGYYVNKKVKDIYYTQIYVTYLCLSSFFFLMFSGAFSDRFGVLSWILIPLLILPLTNKDLNKKINYLNIFMIFILCFSLFLVFNLK